MIYEERRTWWLDTTTLYNQLSEPGRRATGISRVVIELIRAARCDPSSEDRVRLVRFDDSVPSFRQVSWRELDILLECADARKPRRPSLRDMAERLPEPARRRVRFLRQYSRSTTAVLRRLSRRVVGQKTHGGQNIGHPFAPGDHWINLGCWWHSSLPEALSTIGVRSGVVSCVLIHDCIPLAYPEFVPPEIAQDWKRKRAALAEGTNVFITYSTSTQQDVIRELLANSHYVGDFARIRLGDMPLGRRQPQSSRNAALERLRLDQPYVLLVGTIEARKNHALAVRAWRTMMRSGVSPLPRLVFVGKWGWKTRDLRDQLRDSENLSGYVQVLESLSDSDLAAVYQGALFTLFPSLYEGWGLPVRESHAHGKICVAASNSAITEAGDDLAIYFKNDCQSSLIKAVELLISDPSYRQSYEARIAAEFTPVTWDEAWRDLSSELTRLEHAR